MKRERVLTLLCRFDNYDLTPPSKAQNETNKKQNRPQYKAKEGCDPGDSHSCKACTNHRRGLASLFGRTNHL